MTCYEDQNCSGNFWQPKKKIKKFFLTRKKVLFHWSKSITVSYEILCVKKHFSNKSRALTWMFNRKIKGCRPSMEQYCVSFFPGEALKCFGGWESGDGDRRETLNCENIGATSMRLLVYCVFFVWIVAWCEVMTWITNYCMIAGVAVCVSGGVRVCVGAGIP